jgi:hypothetical protein
VETVETVTMELKDYAQDEDRYNAFVKEVEEKVSNLETLEGTNSKIYTMGKASFLE